MARNHPIQFVLKNQFYEILQITQLINSDNLQIMANYIIAKVKQFRKLLLYSAESEI